MVATESVYSEQQVAQYLAKIGICGFPSPTLPELTRIVKQHLYTFPYGALDLVYTEERRISPDLQEIFAKMVVRGREGFCLEHNGLLEQILLGLGFNCYPTVGRPFDLSQPGLPLLGMSHWLLIVTIEGKQYVVDVGYGARGPTTPLPLDAESCATHRIATRDGMHVMEAARVEGWRPLYAFHTTRFYWQDMAVVNDHACISPKIIFNRHFILSIFTETGGISLVDEVLVIKDGGNKDVLTIASKDARRAAIAKYFGIHVDPAAREHLPSQFGHPITMPNLNY